MANRKVIVVMGATGAQGGGLVRAILRDKAGPFSARAVTRNPDSDKARALADLGAAVVAADADDPKSLDPAFAGAYGAYCVTNFWEHFSGERESAQARALAEACKRAGVQHVVWSTLEDTRKLVPLSDDRMPTLKGKYKVPHFDAKGESDHFFTDLGLRTTFSLPSFYWDNLIHFGAGPKPGPDGILAITFPLGDAKMAGIGAEVYRQVRLRDVHAGRCVRRKARRPRGGAPHLSRDGRQAHQGPRPGGPIQCRDARAVS